MVFSSFTAEAVHGALVGLGFGPIAERVVAECSTDASCPPFPWGTIRHVLLRSGLPVIDDEAVGARLVGDAFSIVAARLLDLSGGLLAGVESMTARCTACVGRQDVGAAVLLDAFSLRRQQVSGFARRRLREFSKQLDGVVDGLLAGEKQLEALSSMLPIHVAALPEFTTPPEPDEMATSLLHVCNNLQASQLIPAISSAGLVVGNAIDASRCDSSGGGLGSFVSGGGDDARSHNRILIVPYDGVGERVAWVTPDDVMVLLRGCDTGGIIASGREYDCACG